MLVRGYPSSPPPGTADAHLSRNHLQNTDGSLLSGRRSAESMLPPSSYAAFAQADRKLVNQYPGLPPPRERLKEYKRRDLLRSEEPETVIAGASPRIPDLPPRPHTADASFYPHAPGVQKSTYLHYTPSNDRTELAMEQRWLARRHQSLMEKKQEDEIRGSMVQWSTSRSRIEEEILRRQEATRFSSRFSVRSFVRFGEDAARRPKTSEGTYRVAPVDVSVPVEQLQQEKELNEQGVHKPDQLDTERMRIKKLREIHGRWLHPNSTLGEGTDNLLETQHNAISLSPYFRNGEFSNYKNTTDGEVSLFQKKLEERRNHGPLPPRPSSSPAMLAGSHLDARRQQIQEIDDVKRSLARHRIGVSVAVLERALMTPVDRPPAYVKMNLPVDGSRLLSNPYATDAKKGKRGKKKGKKGAKKKGGKKK